uniref:C2H2-type domain-containing protein n=1 Tax=Strigamia maritima TaxID=126957 RepID=T1IL67_STRMM
MSNKEESIIESDADNERVSKEIETNDAVEEEKEKENKVTVFSLNEQAQIEVKMEKTSETNSPFGEAGDDEDEDVPEAPQGEPGKFFFLLLPIHCAKGKGGRKVYKCDVCGGVYRHAFSLKRHYLRTHINYEYLSEADISNCNISVQQTTKSSQDEELEINPELMNGLYRCHMCSQLFDRIGQLKYHILNHPTQANDKRFPCNQCDMTFSHRQNLVRHLSVHSGEKPYPCRYCGKCFPTATNQKRHERIHEGVKPYACGHCTSLFTQSGDLKKHIRKQHSNFFHPCAFCVKYFIDEAQLEKHLTTHGENAESNRQEVAKRNAGGMQNNKNSPSLRRGGSQKSILDANKFTCSTCSKTFGNYISLRRHEQSMHNVKSASSMQSTSVSKRGEDTPTECILADADFYADIAYNISDNLLNHLDGKLYDPQQPTPPTDDDSNTPPAPVGDRTSVRRNLQQDWTSYNFPSWFNVDADTDSAVDKNASTLMDICDLSVNKPPKKTSTPQTREVHVESVTLSHSDMLYSLALSPVNSSTCSEFQCVDGVLDLSLPGKDRREYSSETLPQVWDLPTTFVCFACGENVDSFDDMEDHKINNHPNVYCTHLEIEGIKDVPLQLFKQHCSPFGILQNCTVPPIISVEENLICTKCSSNFSSVTELHCHMLECGGHKENLRSSPRHGRNKSRKRKTVKRGMKRKLEDTPQKKSTPSVVKKVKASHSDRSSQTSSRSTGSTKTPSFACATCDKKFSQQCQLDRHAKICPQNAVKKVESPKEADKQQHMCAYCSRTFTYVASLKKHMTDCVMRKEKKRKLSTSKSEEKSPKRVKKAESVPQLSSPELDEETNSSEYSEERPSSVLQIKQEVAEDQSVDNVQCCDISPEEEDDVKKVVAEIKLEEDKKSDGGGHCHACPHCRRTYTYLANFKKHVSEACPLRKEITKDMSKDDDKEVYNVDDEDAASPEEIEEVENRSAEVEADIESNKSLEAPEEMELEEVDELEENSKSESKKNRKSKGNEHFTCATCERNFASYVKLLQHQLSHKLKAQVSAESGKKAHVITETKQTVGTKNKKKKKMVTASKAPTKHKGGWPKGKSRKGYVAKHKRGGKSSNAKALKLDDDNKTEDKVEEVADLEVENIKESEVAEKEGKGASETSGEDVNSETAESLLISSKVPLEEQKKNKVLDLAHLVDPSFVQRVRQKKSSLPAADAAPPTVVAS